jgi:hypothetical protein
MPLAPPYSLHTVLLKVASYNRTRGAGRRTQRRSLGAPANAFGWRPDGTSHAAGSASRRPRPSPQSTGGRHSTGARHAASHLEAARLGFNTTLEEGTSDAANAMASAKLQVCHYMTQPLVELYRGCMVVLKGLVMWYCHLAATDDAFALREGRAPADGEWHITERSEG